MEKGPGRVSPFTVPALMPNAAAGHVAMHFGFSGPNACVTTACAAGAHGIGEAYRWIKDGMADACIAGGTENGLIPICLAAFAQAQAASKSTDAPHASRPFDATRNGFVLAEGATAVMLEEAESAVARGARIYAEVAGYGASADAYHITAPHPEGIGAIQAMEACLQDAEEAPEAVEYVNAHGTSTKLNDAAETKAIKKVFGDHAYRLAVSSTKSMTGHLLGAAGALEAAATSLAIHTKTLPRPSTTTRPTRSATSITSRTSHGRPMSAWRSPTRSGSAARMPCWRSAAGTAEAEGKKSSSSRAADSGASLPCTRFSVTSRP